MLQRTQAKQVVPVYEAFVSRFPRPAKVSRSEVSTLIEPLGLAHRVPRIAALMGELAKLGCVPDKMDELRKLPGVGRYVASAVFCFGFGGNVPIVDVNVARVLGRVFGLKPRGRPHNDPNMLELAAGLVPKGKGPQYNEALLDFAALVCRPEPLCGVCPLSRLCVFYAAEKRRRGKQEKGGG